MTVLSFRFSRWCFVLVLIPIIVLSCRSTEANDIRDVGDPLFASPPPLSVVDGHLADAAAGRTKALRRLIRDSSPGTLWILALRSRDLEFGSLSRELMKEAAESEPDPWKKAALIEVLTEDSMAVFLRDRHRVKHPEDPELRAAWLKALAALGREYSLAEELDGYMGIPEDGLVLAAALRRGRSDAIPMAENFIAVCSDPQALRLLNGDSIDLRDDAALLLRARLDQDEGRIEEALNGYLAWLESPPSLEVPSFLFSNIADAAVQAGSAGEWASRLREFGHLLSGKGKYAAAFYAAVLWRKLGMREEAAADFMTAADSAPHGPDRDRALWFLLSLNRDSDDELATLRWVMERWNDPAYFSDWFDGFLLRGVREERWRLLHDVFPDLGRHWPDDIRARTAMILTAAAAEGRLEADDKMRRFWLEEAAALSPLSWAGLRAAGALGEGPRLPDGTLTGAVESPWEFTNDRDLLIRTLLAWGMTDRAAGMLLENPKDPARDSIRKTAEALSAAGKPRPAIHALSHMNFHKDYRPTRSDLFIFHPVLYEDLVQREAGSYGIPEVLFMGLIRVESAWDSQALSRSGAQGLAQLMPETAGEWMRRLKMPEDSEVFDPAVNLRLGAAYLDWLRERDWTDGWPEILVAYNAGGGRLRTWKRQRSFHGPDLFIEGLASYEPRHYVRNVLAAATLYGYLYQGLSPGVLHDSWGLPPLLGAENP